MNAHFPVMNNNAANNWMSAGNVMQNRGYANAGAGASNVNMGMNSGAGGGNPAAAAAAAAAAGGGAVPQLGQHQAAAGHQDSRMAEKIVSELQVSQLDR